MKGDKKKQERLNRQIELLREFEGQENGDCYEEKRLGDNWLVKSWNGGTERWQVAIYTLDSFNRYKSFQK